MPTEIETKVAAHTPGPWNEHRCYPLSEDKRTVRGSEFDYWYGKIAKGDKLIGEMSFQSSTNGGWPQVEDLEEARANTRLAIAAPELLDALNGLLGLLTLIGSRNDMPATICDAIEYSHRTLTAKALVERIDAGIVRPTLEEAQLGASI